VSASPDTEAAAPTPHPSAAQPPSPSRGEGKIALAADSKTATNVAPTSDLPSPLEGEGARRAGEGSARGHARSAWRTPRLSRLRGFAKAMRHEPTEPEAKLWWLLRDRRLANFKFRRQLPMGIYIVDFVCLTAKLIIEADGSQHAESPVDETRDAYLRAQGFRILRIWNNDILARPDMVLEAVWTALQGDAQ
jgi:very-short-patch-repair endonuclease